MITLFNRRELITTFSMDAQAKFRSILSQNGIDYRIKTKSNSTVSYARGRTGTYTKPRPCLSVHNIRSPK